MGNLAAAVEAMPPEVQPISASPIYETEPWGYTEQARFLNQVISAETGLPPEELLAYIKNIEKNVGRTPTFRNGPREIDIDILLYGDLILDIPGLTIPHPRLHERAFMLVPLADITQDLVHPVINNTIFALLKSMPREGITKIDPIN